jgi:hypothetical protein
LLLLVVLVVVVGAGFWRAAGGVGRIIVGSEGVMRRVISFP